MFRSVALLTIFWGIIQNPMDCAQQKLLTLSCLCHGAVGGTWSETLGRWGMMQSFIQKQKL